MIPTRAENICNLAEELPKPGTVKIPPPAKKATEDTFMADFKKLYLRLPSDYRGRPSDQGTEIIKTRLLLQALRDLVSDLKSKPWLHGSRRNFSLRPG
jgi:hypothetical protein